MTYLSQPRTNTKDKELEHSPPSEVGGVFSHPIELVFFVLEGVTLDTESCGGDDVVSISGERVLHLQLHHIVSLGLEVLDELLSAFLDQRVLATGEGRTESGPQVAPSLVTTGEQIFAPERISLGFDSLTAIYEFVEFFHRDLLDQVGVFDDQGRQQKLVHSVVPLTQINERSRSYLGGYSPFFGEFVVNLEDCLGEGLAAYYAHGT
jgi:hypothetical protein